MRYVLGVLAVLAAGCGGEVPADPPVCDDETLACAQGSDDGSTVTGMLYREDGSGIICRAEGEPPVGVQGLRCDAPRSPFGERVCVTMTPVAYYEWWSALPFCGE